MIYLKDRANWINNTRWGLILNPGAGEVAVAQELLYGGLIIIRQMPISGYFADIAIPSKGLVVEIDHPSKRLHKKRQRRRTEAIEAKGWRIIRQSSKDRPSSIWFKLGLEPKQRGQYV